MRYRKFHEATKWVIYSWLQTGSGFSHTKGLQTPLITTTLKNSASGSQITNPYKENVTVQSISS